MPHYVLHNTWAYAAEGPMCEPTFKGNGERGLACQVIVWKSTMCT